MNQSSLGLLFGMTMRVNGQSLAQCDKCLDVRAKAADIERFIFKFFDSSPYPLGPNAFKNWPNIAPTSTNIEPFGQKLWYIGRKNASVTHCVLVEHSRAFCPIKRDLLAFVTL